jgi:hypothetical protein
MAYLLVALTAYQFAFRVAGLQNSALYSLINPYTIIMPFIIFWVGAAIVGGTKTDRSLLTLTLAILAFPCLMLRNFNGDAHFFFLFLRGLQFFWGPALMVPACLGIFRLTGFRETSNDSLRLYLKWMAAITGSLTLFELVAVHILKIPPLTFPWIGNLDELHPQDINPFRPWGLLSYPQPNALVMAYLFWLASVWQTTGLYHKLATLSGVALSGSGTGQIGFAAMASLIMRRPLGVAIIVLIPATLLVTWATLTNQDAAGTNFGRLDIAYLNRLTLFFLALAGRFLGRFTTDELLFGTSNPSDAVVTGYSHDWAYLDVFYAYGIAGVVGYILLFGTLLYLSLPGHLAVGRRLFFSLLGLALNFHYGTLNFYVGQLLFTSIVALRLNGIYSNEVEEIRARRVTVA